MNLLGRHLLKAFLLLRGQPHLTPSINLKQLFSPRRLFYDLLSYFLALLCAINGNLHKDHQGCVAEDTFSSVCVL